MGSARSRGQAAKEFADAQNALHVTIEQTKTIQRDPEAMGEILEALSPVMAEEVSLPMDAVMELQQSGIDLLTPLGISPEAAQTAAEEGQAVHVSLGNLHTMLDAQQFKAASEIMQRRDNEVAARDDENAELDRILRQALNDNELANDVRNGTASLSQEQKTELDAVHEDFRRQLTEAVRSVPGLANQVEIQAGFEPYVDSLLQLWRRRAIVAARRTGENPADIYRRTALNAAQQLRDNLEGKTPEQRIEDDLAKASNPLPVEENTPEPTIANKSLSTLATSTGDEAIRYEVRELDSLIASHDPTVQFQKRVEYPEGVQERPYHSDPGEQDKVRRNAANLDPRYLVNNNPDAMSGPPVITGDGIVLGGNSRTMSIQLAYGQNGERAQGYRNSVLQNAAAYGIDPAQVAGMRQPVLVRVVQRPMSKLEMAQASRRYNEVTTQALQAEAEGVSKSKLITQETLASLAKQMQEYGTLREFLDAAASRDFVQALIGDGVIERTQASRLTESDGRLNAEGKTLVENALRGVIVQDYDVIRNAPDSALNKIDRAIPYLAQLKARGEGWDMSNVVTEALRVLGTAKAEDKDVSIYLGQGSLLQSRESVRPAVQAMALTLDRATQKEVALRFACMAKDAGKQAKGQMLLGVAADSNTPAKSFINAFMRTVASVGGDPVTDYSPRSADNNSVVARISPEAASTMGLPKAGDFIARESDLAPIDQKHGEQFRSMGFANAREFVNHVIEQVDAVYKGGGSNIYIFVRRGERKSGQVVAEFEAQYENGRYRVTTAHPVRNTYFAKRTPLWERAPSSHSASGTPGAYSGQSGVENSITIPDVDGKPLFSMVSPGRARGAVTNRDGNYFIDLFQKADLSTLAHEMGHVYFLELERSVAQGVADAQMEADLATLRQWTGAAEGQALTTEQHEQLARGWEAYLMEGKAPTGA